ncbi:MAG: GntR family transcriptional regulator [Verrucomicrobiae bacterium]|nr:GntR family transcriptional regulator [Verrucomicrobiae bacterium]
MKITKIQSVHNQLVSLANRLGPEAKLPTVKQLCRDLQVSVATLDRCLQNLEFEHVIERKHGVGIFVSPFAGQKVVALASDCNLFQSNLPLFFRMFIEYMRNRAALGKMRIKFYLDFPTNEGEPPSYSDLEFDLNQRRVHGVILLDSGNFHIPGWLLHCSTPCVAFSARDCFPWSVKINHVHLVELGVKLLLEQGCHRPIFLPPVYSNRETVDHIISIFHSGLAKFNPDIHSSWVLNPMQDVNATPSIQGCEELAYRAVMRFFEEREKFCGNLPDGLLSVDDALTPGAIQALKKLGFRLGCDFWVATHINKGAFLPQAKEDSLILLQIDLMQVVDRLWSQLETLAVNQTPEDAVVWIEPQAIELPFKPKRDFKN